MQETGWCMNRVREWAAWSPAPLPGYPKLSNLELHYYPPVSVGQKSGFSCTGPPAHHPKVLWYPRSWGTGLRLGSLTWLLVGFGPLRTIDWRSSSVPGHVGPQAIHIIRVSARERARERGRETEGDKPARQRSPGLLRPDLAFADLVTRWGHTQGKGIGQGCEVTQVGGPPHFLVSFGKLVPLLLVYMLNV